MDTLFDLIVVGAGPAGMTAAIYAKRAGLNVLVIEGSAPGGKLIKTFEIDNWPGNNHISGVDLAMQMYNHTADLNIPVEFINVSKIEAGKPMTVLAENNQTFQAKAIIIATGTVENMMKIDGEIEAIGKGLSFCAVCDGAFFKEKEVVVIGGGNSALEEAIYLTQFASKVTIIIRRDVFRADDLVVQHVLANPKIAIIKHHIPIKVLLNQKVVGIEIENVETHEKQVINCSGIFPYIGAKPSTQMVEHLKVCDEFGFMITNAKMETSVKGLYGAGDVVVKPLRQIVTAVSDGAVAAQ
ncbi:MAG: FAD-dependent oxidoreductase, partial [Erysipelotrichaceae bacterium]